MTKKILIIQSRTREEMLAGEQEEYLRSLGGSAEPVFISSLDTTIDWHDPQSLLQEIDAVILGGSGEFDFDGGRAIDDPARITSKEITKRLSPLVSYIMEHHIPLLGICYGHQIISETLGIPVVNDHKQHKVGTFEVVLTEMGKQDPLFSNLPQTFMAQYGHKDSLSKVPEGAVVLATGTRCQTSALRYGKNIYSTQFHPELRAEDIGRKLSNSPGYLPEHIRVEDIIKPSPEASMIIPLFIEKIVTKP